jgi:uncharacterized MnhB-related membrane protein
MSNKLNKISAVFSSNKMKVFDWVLSFISLAVAGYYYFIAKSPDVAVWWAIGGSLGIVFSIWRPVDKIQHLFQRATINKE